MMLKTIKIDNFRGITSLQLDLDRTTVLVGENNTGKTSLLDALHLCMSRGLSRRAMPFNDYDFHLASDDAVPADSPPIVITLTFEESKVDEWADEVVQSFPGTIQILDDGRQQVILRVTGQFDKSLGEASVEWAFLDTAGHPLPAKPYRQLSDLQNLAPVFLLSAVREATHHFHPKSSFWGPFTKNPQFPDDKREAIEEQIEQLNQSVLDSHRPFDEVKIRLAKTGTLLPLASKDIVSIEAVPARIVDVLARTEVKLAARTGARLPISQHGAGTQSLSVMFLFEAFLQSRLAEAYDKHTEPILALEEPESHLHPSATRALWSVLDSFAGQKLIATHSGELLGAVPLGAIRRLARKNGKVEVFRIKETTLDMMEAEKVSYHVRVKRGSLLFARCWLLVEGQTEFTMLPELARILDIDLDLAGVSCVEVSQSGVGPLVKSAKDLGIEWHLLVDGDGAGQRYAKSASQFVEAGSVQERITSLTAETIEWYMWDSGYSAIYEAEVHPSHRAMVTSAQGSPTYPREVIAAAARSTSKPHLAHAVLAEAIKRGSAGVPAQLRSAIDMAVGLAGRSA